MTMTAPSTTASANDMPSANGFPQGYFILRSIANNRVLDVARRDTQDGAEIILYPSLETSLVETRRDPGVDNQVWFIDESGALCSKASGYAVDIEGDELVLRHRRPLIQPYPNQRSHPLPKFSYSQDMLEVSVTFQCHPRCHSNAAADANWQKKIYLLAARPKRRDPNLFDAASNFVNNTLTATAFSIFGGQKAPAVAEPGALAAIGAELDEEDILDEEQGEEAEVDDSPEPVRAVRVLSTSKSTEEDRGLVQSARTRRKWKVESISATDARTGSRSYAS